MPKKLKLPTLVLYSGEMILLEKKLKRDSATMTYKNETGYSIVITRQLLRFDGYHDMRLNLDFARSSPHIMNPGDTLVLEVQDAIAPEQTW